MTRRESTQNWRPVIAAVLMACGGALLASTPKATSPSRFDIGSPVVASAEPLVSRPATTPCTVTLLDHHAFDEHGDASSMDARPYAFDFTPPRGCRGGWGKVVLEADFSVPAGRQFDRTVALWLGGINLYFGTTIEPSPDVAQHWHVERDLTDYASLFTHTQAGQMILNNWVSPTTNSPIVVSAQLKFYPADAHLPAAGAADHVYALSSDPRGEQTPLDTPNASLSRKLTFPRNVERAYLDVIAQSQAHDERWYTCVDKAYLEQTRAYSLEGFEACDGGSFRGVEVLLDGQPAGLAPVYPWIFTGGIAPHLWLPTPGIQTVNFIPFRVDLTPFAGLLDDGKPHTVSVRVPGADHFFNVAANLLVYQDHQSRQLGGRIVRNTLARQPPAALIVRDTLHPGSHGASEGTLNTDQTQSYVIVGRLHTSRGTIDTTVRYRGGFHNHQTFRQPAAKRYVETIDQSTSLSLTVERSLGGHPLDGYTLRQDDPLYLSVDKSVVTKGQDFTALVAMRQGHRIDRQQTNAHGTAYHASLQENLSTRARADGKTIPDPLDRSDFAHHEQGTEQVSFVDSFGSCYRTDLASSDERLTGFSQGKGCPDQINHLDSRSRPDSPSLAPL
ncbi:hypothetical protein CS053_06710 [Rhodanobacter glycinis]|uniref:Peptide N-acetyl-beta-D-glucosaminyl asparaginase amidase A N-terminal domain-containing protein n=1 Tax=Rhodanobacter glycinis TaxID=582702 RepID=A0A5B9DYG1_9GAMM|nr:hypothetical protein CS053_06710 [Rhodanobacter glycinis]